MVAHPFEGALPIARPSGLPPYLVMVTLLAPATFSPWDAAADNGARVLVHIVDPEAKTRLQAHYLQQIFGLTDAETRIAALIGSLNLPEIARVLGISTNTVKTHVGRSFGKTGVRSQAGLARLIAAIPITEIRDDLTSDAKRGVTDFDPASLQVGRSRPAT